VGLLVGPALRLEAWQRDEQGVAPTLSTGPTGRLSLKVGKVALSGGATPLWALTEPAEGGTGRSLVTHGALALDSKPFAWRLNVDRAQHDAGTLWTVALGLQLRLL